MPTQRTQALLMTALCTALTIIGGFLRFPIPGLSVQFTTQVFFVLLSGLLLGAKYGALSQLAYVLLGLVGLPIFTKGGGVHYIFQPEFGYLLGFIGAAFTCGLVRGRFNGAVSWYVAGILGVLAFYAIALAYIAVLSGWILHNPLPARTLLMGYCLAFLPLDLAKAVLAASVGIMLRKRLGHGLPAGH